MFCGECGTENPDTNQFCKNCGKPLKKKNLQPAPAAGTPASPHPAPTAPGPRIPGKPGASKKWILFGAIIIVVILAATALLLLSGFMTIGLTPAALPVVGTAFGPGPGSAASPAAPAGAVVHGTISSGAITTAAQGTMSAAGGTITVNQPGSAIDGLKVTAPAGAYPSGRQVTISSAPITGNTFGSNFNPATPLIAIDAGNGYAEEPILVTIPVTIPDDQFAMAFYYDDATQKLEGIPTAGQDSRSITIATRHFSKILVSMISLSSLNGITKVDSGFRPGVDDWEFVNDGSYIAPKGHCAGQSATMMWYYTEQRQKANAPPLFNRYDNNGRAPAAPKFDRDDTVGYRFASVMQKITDQQKYWNNPGSFISNVSDIATFREFKYSMLMTGEPQYVGIYRSGGGHAIVCYEVSDTTLWIADPNYPGKERMITLSGNTLGPYTSGASSTDIKQNGVRVYPVINYIAKSAYFSWPTLAAEYAKVRDGTIGSDSFPPYTLDIIVDKSDGTQEILKMEGGTNTGVKRFEVTEKAISIMPESNSYETNAGTVTVYLPDGRIKNIEPDMYDPVPLSEGSNLMAVELYSATTKSWLGFDWIDVVYKPPQTTPAPATRTLTTARDYAVSSTWRTDPGCPNMENPWADTNCVPATTRGTRMQILPYCGSPPEQCINPQVNNGIEGEFTYYTKTEGGVLIPVIDGWWLHYYKGEVDSKEKFRDGGQVGSCQKYSTGWDCYGDTS